MVLLFMCSNFVFILRLVLKLEKKKKKKEKRHKKQLLSDLFHEAHSFRHCGLAIRI